MPRNVRAPLLAAAGCLTALGILVFAAYSVGPVEHLDVRVFLHFQLVQSPGTLPATELIHLGDLGPLLVLMALVVGLGLHFGRRREVVAALTVIVGANLTTQVLKVLLEHSRDGAGEALHPAWVRLLPSDTSFPSGHTTAAAAVAVALLFVVPARHLPRAAVAGVLLTASVACSVVILGWHYPSDALGAMLVAACWGFMMIAALRLPWRDGRPGSRGRATMNGRLLASGD